MDIGKVVCHGLPREPTFDSLFGSPPPGAIELEIASNHRDQGESLFVKSDEELSPDLNRPDPAKVDEEMMLPSTVIGDDLDHSNDGATNHHQAPGSSADSVLPWTACKPVFPTQTAPLFKRWGSTDLPLRRKRAAYILFSRDTTVPPPNQPEILQVSLKRASSGMPLKVYSRKVGKGQPPGQPNSIQASADASSAAPQKGEKAKQSPASQSGSTQALASQESLESTSGADARQELYRPSATVSARGSTMPNASPGSRASTSVDTPVPGSLSESSMRCQGTSNGDADSDSNSEKKRPGPYSYFCHVLKLPATTQESGQSSSEKPNPIFTNAQGMRPLDGQPARVSSAIATPEEKGRTTSSSHGETPVAQRQQTPATEPVPKVRKYSCVRCKKKRTTCDSELPKCGNCEKCGDNCHYNVDRSASRANASETQVPSPALPAKDGQAQSKETTARKAGATSQQSAPSKPEGDSKTPPKAAAVPKKGHRSKTDPVSKPPPKTTTPPKEGPTSKENLVSQPIPKAAAAQEQDPVSKSSSTSNSISVSKASPQRNNAVTKKTPKNSKALVTFADTQTKPSVNAKDNVPEVSKEKSTGRGQRTSTIPGATQDQAPEPLGDNSDKVSSTHRASPGIAPDSADNDVTMVDAPAVSNKTAKPSGPGDNNATSAEHPKVPLVSFSIPSPSTQGKKRPASSPAPLSKRAKTSRKPQPQPDPSSSSSSSSTSPKKTYNSTNPLSNLNKPRLLSRLSAYNKAREAAQSAKRLLTARKIYVLRLYKLHPLSTTSDTIELDEELDIPTSAPTNPTSPDKVENKVEVICELINETHYTCLDVANRAARDLQIEMSMQKAVEIKSEGMRVWQKSEIGKLNEKLRGLRDEGVNACWKGVFNGREGEKWEVKVEGVRLFVD
ncbi:hypothetical protein BCR34DRAFT_601893 [Clohesyomyces aquaticus]|uniref:Zn(2)-C6 fungal-type domain-containing protein n=1 Tax=Clohesyomyces aquaticus TaxID=1231657 RepID=A0A1Y1ZKH3_9PLEO|nr:hypothetical protein BCR34DRAFT_601893 [Clohesyomyces aquaticus]